MVWAFRGRSKRFLNLLGCAFGAITGDDQTLDSTTIRRLNFNQMRETVALDKHTKNVILWVAENRGVMSEIAREFQVSVQFVSQVLRGMRRSQDIEQALRELGAPVPEPDSDSE